MTFEQKFEGGDDVGHVDILGKNILQGDNRQCKGPGTEACLVCSRGSKMARRAGAEEAKE